MTFRCSVYDANGTLIEEEDLNNVKEIWDFIYANVRLGYEVDVIEVYDVL